VPQQVPEIHSSARHTLHITVHNTFDRWCVRSIAACHQNIKDLAACKETAQCAHGDDVSITRLMKDAMLIATKRLHNQCI